MSAALLLCMHFLLQVREFLNSPSHIPVLIEHQLRVMNTKQLGQSPYVNMGTAAVVDQTRPPLLFFNEYKSRLG